MKKTILFALLLGIGGLATAQTSKVDLSKYPTPVTFTKEQDHANMQQQLGIKVLRPGPSGNESAPNAANDKAKFRGLMENWYEDQMDRVAGWYKRKLTFLTFIIGLVIACTFNVDTIRLTTDLSKMRICGHCLWRVLRLILRKIQKVVPRVLSMRRENT